MGKLHEENLDEVLAALRNENERHEMRFMGRDTSLYVIGVIDVDDHRASQGPATTSNLKIDVLHREFKKFREGRCIELLPINAAKPPLERREAEIISAAGPTTVLRPSIQAR